MSKKQYGVLLAVALVAGLLSGVVSSYFMVGRLIAAQKLPPQVVEQPPHTAKVIQAERFEVVNKDGKIRAVLGEPTREFFRATKQFDELNAEKMKELLDVPYPSIYEEEPLLPGLFLLDEAGTLGAELGMTEIGMGLFLHDAYGDFSRLSAGWMSVSHVGGSSAFLDAEHAGPGLSLHGPEGRDAHLDAGAIVGPSLTLVHNAGEASLAVRDKGPSLDLNGPGGGRASLDVSPFLSGFPDVKDPDKGIDRPSLNLYGGYRPPRGENSELPKQASVSLDVSPPGPSLTFNHPRGPEGSYAYDSASLGVGSEGPSLALSDQAGKTRAKLNLEPDGSPSLHLSDQTGKPRVALGEIDLEYPRTGATEKRPISSLMLFDKDGKVLWQAP